MAGALLETGRLIVNGLYGVVAVVWSGVKAAGEYFQQLGEALVRFADTVVQAAVGVLKSVATVLEAALAAVLAFIEHELTVLLRPVIDDVSGVMNGYLSGLWHDFGPLWSAQNNSVSPAHDAAAGFLNDLFGGPFLIALGIGVVVEIALTVASLVAPGAGTIVADVVENLAVQAVVSAFALIASTLVPSILSLPAYAGVAWLIYNATGGGQHSMLRPAASVQICGGIVAAAFAAVSVGTAVVQLGVEDAPQARYAIYLLQLFSRGGFGGITLVPAISIALDVMSLLFALATLPVVGPIQGGEAHTLNIIGLFVGAIGLALSIAVKGFANPADKALLQQFGPIIDLGFLLGVGGTTINLVQVVAGC